MALEAVDAWYRSLNDARRATSPARRADAPDFEVGVSTVYENLGTARLALGDVDGAAAAFQRQRVLAPTASGSYLGMAGVERARGRRSEALGELLQGLLLDSSRAELAERAVELDRDLHPPAGCILAEQEGSYAFNPRCPETQTFLCRAYAGLRQAFRAAARLPDEQRRRMIREIDELAAADACAPTS